MLKKALNYLKQDEVRSSATLCQVCGCRGPLSCGACKSVSYCSKEHQTLDWSQGNHKKSCRSNETFRIGNQAHKYLLDEFDLVTEPEEIADSNLNKEDENDEARRLKEYEEFLEKNKKNSNDDLADVPDEEFEKYTSQIDDDKVFAKFKKRISNEPEQVIRFDRGGKPLWITTKNQLKETDIPLCDKCNGPRIFEFQV